MTTQAVPIDGDVAAGFGRVADEFRANFVDRGELGAACAVYRHGQPVVDLWGGHRDPARTTRWERDTLVTVFSTTKGMASIAMAVAHGRGLFELDSPVASYWPEFAQAGKGDISVRQLLTHQAGLAVIDTAVDVEMLADPDALGDALAAQRPRWEPGTRHGYHGQSLGWYESQLLRRVDPKRRTIGRFFADEVAGVLDVEFFIGLPDDIGPERLATIVGGGLASTVLHLHEMPPRLVLAVLNPLGLTGRVFRNPKALTRITDINHRDLLRLELPSVNGTGTARALAAVYGNVATGGDALELGQRTVDELEAPPIAPSGGPRDLVLLADTAYGFGMMKPFPMLPFGSSPRSYGHTGLGGSFAYADPARGLGYAYVLNRAGYAVPADPREVALRRAVEVAAG